jgi:hypothetical protein
VLTDPRGDRPTVYRLAGKAEDLARHVGHTVEAAGTISTPAAAQPALTVTSLVWLRASCSK